MARTLWLQVAVDEAHEMEVLERCRDFGGVEASVVLWNALARTGLERSEEFTSAAVFHAEVEVVFGLERVVQRHDEGMVARREDFLLGEGALDLVSLDHLPLAQDCDAKISCWRGCSFFFFHMRLPFMA